jgi:hypothetical protein
MNDYPIPRTPAERAALRKVFEREAQQLRMECRKAGRKRNRSRYRIGITAKRRAFV